MIVNYAYQSRVGFGNDTTRNMLKLFPFLHGLVWDLSQEANWSVKAKSSKERAEWSALFVSDLTDPANPKISLQINAPIRSILVPPLPIAWGQVVTLHDVERHILASIRRR